MGGSLLARARRPESDGAAAGDRVAREHGRWSERPYVRLGLLAVVALALAAAVAGDSAAQMQGRPVESAVPALIRSVSAVSGDMRPGGEARVTLRLLDRALPLSVGVFVTYADGATQYVEERVGADDATLTWVIPDGAPPGSAHVRLFATRTCQCGALDLPRQDTTDGEFRLAAPERG